MHTRKFTILECANPYASGPKPSPLVPFSKNLNKTRHTRRSSHEHILANLTKKRNKLAAHKEQPTRAQNSRASTVSHSTFV